MLEARARDVADQVNFDQSFSQPVGRWFLPLCAAVVLEVAFTDLVESGESFKLVMNTWAFTT